MTCLPVSLSARPPACLSSLSPCMSVSRPVWLGTLRVNMLSTCCCAHGHLALCDVYCMRVSISVCKIVQQQQQRQPRLDSSPRHMDNLALGMQQCNIFVLFLSFYAHPTPFSACHFPLLFPRRQFLPPPPKKKKKKKKKTSHTHGPSAHISHCRLHILLSIHSIRTNQRFFCCCCCCSFLFSVTCLWYLEKCTVSTKCAVSGLQQQQHPPPNYHYHHHHHHHHHHHNHFTMKRFRLQRLRKMRFMVPIFARPDRSWCPYFT